MTQAPRKHKPYAGYLALFASVLGLFACTPPQHREDPPPKVQNAAPSQQEPAHSSPSHALSSATEEGPANTARQCPEFSAPRRIGTIEHPQLNELSGLISSRRASSVFWTHNDSGSAPRLYALGREARLLATVELPVQAIDWEDIAIADSPAGTPQLYIADSGDNRSKRDSITIHRITEPKISARDTHLRLRTRDVESMILKYPDGAHDAEAMFVDPHDGAIYLFTKPRLGWPRLYSVASFKAQATLETGPRLSPLETSQALHWVTAADISRDGHWIAVRTYNQLVLFSRLPGMTIAEALTTPACAVAPPQERQGEAVTFAFQGGNTPVLPALHTVSEGLPSALFQIESHSLGLGSQ